jgi:hypothetical protein
MIADLNVQQPQAIQSAIENQQSAMIKRGVP